MATDALNVRIAPELKVKIARAAALSGVSQTAIVVDALKQYFDMDSEGFVRNNDSGD